MSTPAELAFKAALQGAEMIRQAQKGAAYDAFKASNYSPSLYATTQAVMNAADVQFISTVAQAAAQNGETVRLQGTFGG
jgi:hypothetical protein